LQGSASAAAGRWSEVAQYDEISVPDGELFCAPIPKQFVVAEYRQSAIPLR